MFCLLGLLKWGLWLAFYVDFGLFRFWWYIYGLCDGRIQGFMFLFFAFLAVGGAVCGLFSTLAFGV